MVAAHKQDEQRNALDTTSDPTLTPPGAQFGATCSNPGQRKRSRYAGFANSCIPLKRMTYHWQ